MNNKNTIPVWFTIVAVLAILWNLIGVAAFVGQLTLTPEQLATMSVAQQEYYNTMPLWATIAFAVAVFSGTIASLLLLMKKQWATLLYGVSIVAIIIQNIHAFILADAYQKLGSESLILPSTVFIVAVALWWFTNQAKHKHWLH